jgi:rhodanese-related sulfurtransferase
MRKARRVLLEAVAVAAAGLLFALAANALSPRGLRLTRNYFPGGAVASAVVQPSTNSAPGAATGSQNSFEATLRRLEQHGLQPMAGNAVVELFHDLRYEQGLVILVDARDDAHYQAGHIPGAWQFDHYHPEQYLPAVLPVCLNAQKVVVYCTGGACEDSEFAAIMLREAGVPRDSLFVYTGGITEWMTNGQPLESGARGSGVVVRRKP